MTLRGIDDNVERAGEGDDKLGIAMIGMTISSAATRHIINPMATLHGERDIAQLLDHGEIASRVEMLGEFDDIWFGLGHNFRKFHKLKKSHGNALIGCVDRIERIGRIVITEIDLDSDRFLMDDAEESVHKLGRESMSGSLFDATGYQLVVSLLLHDRNITT